MIEFATSNWGGLASAVGLVVSTGGLAYAIVVARGARSASRAAQTAANETRTQIARHLQTVDLERAIGTIQRIKLLHDIRRWEAAMEQYPALRTMLSGISARCSGEKENARSILEQGIKRVENMENFVRKCINSGIGDSELADLEDLNPVLNEIERTLVALSSNAGLENLQDET